MRVCLVVIVFGAILVASAEGATSCCPVFYCSGWKRLYANDQKCYFVSSDKATGYWDASARCKAKDKDAELVALETWTEMWRLSNYLKSTSTMRSRTYWIGGQFSADPPDDVVAWRWKQNYNTGPSLSSSWWWPGQPNHEATAVSMVTLYHSSSARFRWADRSIYHDYRYICEIKRSKLGLTDIRAASG